MKDGNGRDPGAGTRDRTPDRPAPSAESRVPPAFTQSLLDDLLSRPTPAAVDALRRCPGDVVVLGAGGKMGPTLARLVRRCVDEGDAGARRVIAVSRWSDAEARRALEAWGIETASADLTDRASVAALPDAPNVVFMAGQKFGTTGNPAATWAMNVLAPALCADRYAASRIVAFSTGNVYPLTPAARGGSIEDDALAPVGDYAASCVGRERMFAWASARAGTRVAILRLNYAIALRYGVLTDLALMVWKGEPVSLAMGYVNVIWQGDANALAVAALPHAASPPLAINLTGHATLSVRELATALGRALGRTPVFEGTEAPDALLSNTARMRATLGEAVTAVDDMVAWTAAWVKEGGALLGKATKFERRDGQY